MNKFIILLFIIGIIYFTIKIYYVNKNNDISTIEKFAVTSSNKKLGFCFLIYDKINNEKIWYKYLKNIDRNKYNIYIHYKDNKPLEYFEKYKLDNCIPTKRGDISVVMAQNVVLKEALKDKNNMHFIWLSGHCIPLKNFDYIYDYLNSKYSYYNICPDNQVFPRANNALKYIDKTKIKKANMASIINRKHAEIFVKYEKKLKLWFNNINNVDEIAYISLLHYLNLRNELMLTDNIAAGAIIFAQWADMKNYKLFNESRKINDYTYKYICNDELKYLVESKSLFGRKFEDNCEGLENLMTLLNKVHLPFNGQKA